MLVKDLIGDKKETITKYLTAITSSNGTVRQTNHEKMVKSGDKTAKEIDEILVRGHVAISVLKYLLDHPEIEEYSDFCPVCHKPMYHKKGLIKTCSASCGAKYCKEKAKKTMLAKYGVENPAQSKEIQEKIKKTNMEKYGVERAVRADCVKEKARKTNIEKYGAASHTSTDAGKEKVKEAVQIKYGVDNVAQLQSVQDKIVETTREKYGVDHVFQAQEVKDKIAATNLERYGNVCSLHGEESIRKKKETWTENYGVDNPMKSEEIRDKAKTTNLEKYGVENPFQAKEVKEKIKDTMSERYGAEHALQVDEFKEKAKNTTFERFGVENAAQAESVKVKTRATNVAKYGVESAAAAPEVREKIKATNKEKYGNENAIASEPVRKKIKETFTEKYGVDNPLSSKEVQMKIRENLRRDRYSFFKRLLESRNISMLTPYEEHLNADSIHFKCNRCGKEFDSHWAGNVQDSYIWCPDCHKSHSNGEEQVYEFVSSIVNKDEIVRNTRSILEGNKELDIYIPSKKLAIEFNGVYWHCAENVGENYHLNKTVGCKEKDITLIQILENEWLYKRDIVESIIKMKLGIIGTKIFARNCEVVKLSENKYREFLELNHIQGFAVAKIRLGLTYEGELVACIGIGASRFKKGEIELIRFCTKLNTEVIGGLSKLVKASNIASREEDFVSYIDRRYFDGSGYSKAGFVLVGESRPSYIYARKDKILSRYQCQKQLLPELLGDKFDENLTEEENMALAGYDKIYDCGNLKFKYVGAK